MRHSGYFKFKQFEVKQTKSAMKIGTDGVLLGGWADIEKAKQILDVGTGTGLIALMCAQRNPKAQITAIEIEPFAAEEAAFNFRNSPWADRLNLIQKDFKQIVFDQKFDVIISNPPYFSQAVQPNKKQRILARHTSGLNLEELINKAETHLSEDGTVFLILPTSQQEEIHKIAEKTGLYIQKKCLVKGHAQAQPKRILLKLGRSKQQVQTGDIIIEEKRHLYTPKYKNLTKNFYLNL